MDFVCNPENSWWTNGGAFEVGARVISNDPSAMREHVLAMPNQSLLLFYQVHGVSVL